jgi:tetratricopeptide (TPR) repeat protein
LREANDKNGVRRMIVQYLKFGIDAYRERTRQYPTDFRVKFQLAARLTQAGLFDEAIPLFQESRADPKIKTRCNLYVGQCFFEKRNYKQSIASFEEALAGVQVAGDEISREVHYGLGRACEAHGQTERALELYNQLLQWDYNFKDTQSRVEKLRGSG